ncbi:hypothetical protein EYF80_067001 [Liparis tanakae]|uniref:Uncharacterized protein n=1 Tax=Liparis tanakae TaxID=230148 RepID=A0A4Z2E2C0_9TELE|nr:hypothetical protein EYF80_067001 [Liparis tanakae]
MQCVNVLKKRRLEPEVDSWSCIAKRVCVAKELQADCPMETSLSPAPANQHQGQQVRSHTGRPGE